MTAYGRQTRPRPARRGDWMRAGALIAIACLLFNALVASGHDLRMAAQAAGLGGTVAICTPYGAASLPASAIPGGDPAREAPAGVPGWHCPYCTFAKVAGSFLIPDALACGPALLAARSAPPVPPAVRLAAHAPESQARPRAPPVSV